LQLISYPYSAPVILTDIGLTNVVAATTALAADNVTLFDPYEPPATQYKQFYLRINTAEGNKPMWRFAGTPQFWATNVVIQPHQGFWYQSKSNNPFTWRATRPYSLGD
jgi:hypothetical protein